MRALLLTAAALALTQLAAAGDLPAPPGWVVARVVEGPNQPSFLVIEHRLLELGRDRVEAGQACTCETDRIDVDGTTYCPWAGQQKYTKDDPLRVAVCQRARP